MGEFTTKKLVAWLSDLYDDAGCFVIHGEKDKVICQEIKRRLENADKDREDLLLEGF